MGFVAVRWRLGGLEIGRRKRRRPTVGKRIRRIGSKGGNSEAAPVLGCTN